MFFTKVYSELCLIIEDKFKKNKHIYKTCVYFSFLFLEVSPENLFTTASL